MEINIWIKIEELVVKLNENFNTNFTIHTVNNLRRDQKIPAIDVRTPGTKMARWKYCFEDVKLAISSL